MKKSQQQIRFEDWYIKILDANQEHMMIYIIRTGSKLAAHEGSFQILEDINGEQSLYSIPITNVKSSKEEILFDGSKINKNEIRLQLKQGDLSLIGELELKDIVDLEKSYWKPGLMGFYKHIPFLEFYQEILVLNGTILGKIQVGEKEIDFSGGSCYIQMQWGREFPNIWILAQCNRWINNKDIALMLGITRLKLFFNYYTAFAIPVYYNNQLEIFSNYNGGHITKLYRYKGYVHLVITQKDKLLDIKIYGRDEIECTSIKETHGIRDVYEGNRVKIEVKISKQGMTLLECTSLECSIEMGGNTSKLK